MERQSSTQDRRQYGLLLKDTYFLDAQWGNHFTGIVFHGFADLIGHDFANAFQVAAETHTVQLDFGVTDLRHHLIKKAVMQFKVVYFYHNARV